MSEPRSIELSVEVPGSPEEVWDAIATGPGISSWFVPHELEGREGGEVLMDFGSYGKERSTVAVWDPPRRIVFRAEGDAPLAYEWLVEARDGGTCVVRLVNTGFGEGDEWDAQYDGMSEGWTIFMQSLRLQLTHFRGRRAQAFVPTVTLPGPLPDAWSKLCEVAGVRDDLEAGDPIQAGEGRPPLAGRVESTVARAKAMTYLLLLDQPAAGTAFLSAEAMGDQVACSLYLYLYDLADESGARAWTDYLTDRFPALQGQS